MNTTQIAYYLVAQSWIAALIIELDVDPPRQALRDITALIVIAVEELLDGSVTTSAQVMREVRSLLKRWPKGTPPTAQASAEIIDITDYTIAA